jgi:plasmid stabilization system protein ParE
VADLVFSARAIRSLRNAADWLHARNPDAARRLVEDVGRTCGMLERFPMAGFAVEGTGLRCAVTLRYRYRILYRVDAGRIAVRDILHPRRG